MGALVSSLKESPYFPLPRRDLSVWTERVFPLLRNLIHLGYFSLEVKGLKNVPRKGPVIYAGNHAGWFTLDSFFFSLALTQWVPPERIPYAIIHDILLKLPLIKQIFSDKGVLPASWFKTPERIPPEVESFGFYPEGESGNCKPFWDAYRMRPWRTGFARLAILRRARVVPVAMIGGEESCPVGFNIRIFRKLLGSPIPIPLVPIPLPTRWKFVFGKPVDFGKYPQKTADDIHRLRAIAEKMRRRLQKTLDREIKGRPLARLSSWVNSEG